MQFVLSFIAESVVTTRVLIFVGKKVRQNTHIERSGKDDYRAVGAGETSAIIAECSVLTNIMDHNTSACE